MAWKRLLVNAFHFQLIPRDFKLYCSDYTIMNTTKKTENSLNVNLDWGFYKTEVEAYIKKLHI